MCSAGPLRSSILKRQLKDGTRSGYIQAKACHPDRSTSFYLTEKEETWQSEAENMFCVLVWLGTTETNKPPRYWIAHKNEVGKLCATKLRKRNVNDWNRERRLFVDKLGEWHPEWENRWSLFDQYNSALLNIAEPA
jgi:hypothetical protein